MDKDNYNRILNSPEIINNYDLLKGLGILEIIESLNKDVKDLNELIEESIKIFNKDSIPDLIGYTVEKLLDKFIPSNLAFIIQDEIIEEKINIFCFSNMKPVENKIKIKSIKPYKKFFKLSPATITFDAFVHMINKKKLTDVFIPLDPELLVPISGYGGLYGFIVFGKKIIEKDYSAQELEYINRIMSFLSVSIQNIINYKNAIIDSKTKLYKHSFFMKKLDSEISRVKRYNSKCSVLMIDIDYFKIINDTYGHLTGDKVLRIIADLLKENIRNEDIACRFGGEEFSVLLVESDKKGAFLTAERIRKVIKNLEIEYLGKKISVTVSIGVSCASKNDNTSTRELIKMADKALYISKSNGRDKTTVYEEKKVKK